MAHAVPSSGSASAFATAITPIVDPTSVQRPDMVVMNNSLAADHSGENAIVGK